MNHQTQTRIRFLIFLVLCLGAALVLKQLARAGGPLLVGGPVVGVSGTPFTWDTSVPVPYRVDGGPLSMVNPSTVVVDHAAALTQISDMFQVWQDVPTAAITYSNAGPLLSVGAFTDGDVSTVEEFDAVIGSCLDGTQSPIVLDANGSMFNALIGDPNVIGFAGTCLLDGGSGKILSGLGALNGRFRDGVEDFAVSPPNFELTDDEFDEVFVHEFGHFSGLDHSQINVEVLNQTPGACSVTDRAGLPLMFPFLFCQARGSVGLPVLSQDDAVWISKLYPSSTFSSTYGTISGLVVFSDGVTHAQGINVIARQTSDPRGVAVSSVTGYLFTGNPGQSVTADYLPCDPPSACPGGFAGNNSGGSLFGSRDSLVIGFYEISVPPGSYTLEVESVSPFFGGGAGVGPLSPPIPNPGPDESWNGGESSSDDPAASNVVIVSAGGSLMGINIILNATGPRFDSLEGPLAKNRGFLGPRMAFLFDVVKRRRNPK